MIKGKVLLLPFPFGDLSVAKLRPPVCLMEPIGPHNHIVLAFITSQILPDLLETDFVLDARRADFALAGLKVSSTLRLHRSNPIQMRNYELRVEN